MRLSLQLLVLGIVAIAVTGCNKSSTGDKPGALTSQASVTTQSVKDNEAASASSPANDSSTPAVTAKKEGLDSVGQKQADEPLVGAAAATALSAATNGASSGSISDVKAPETSDPAALALVKESLKVYSSAQSYSDEAVWRMEVPMEGNPIDRKLDMRLAWQAPNKLAIKSAHVSSAWTSETFETVAGTDNERPFDNQRVVRPRPEKITWEWLMYNHLSPLLDVARANRPLALELLLNPSPLGDWLENATFRTAEKDVFDHHSCQKVEVFANEGRYVLWIDEQRKLILRMELPLVYLQQLFGSALGSVDPAKVAFSIDMVNAQVNQVVDWSGWSMPREKGQVLVRRFTEPPPRDIPAEIGARIKPVALKNVDGVEIFDSSHPTKPVMILQWIDESDVSGVFIDTVRELRKEIQRLGLSSFVDTLLVTASTAEQIKPALAKWNCDLPVALEVEKELGSQCGVTRLLTSVILANDGQIQIIDPLSSTDYLLHIVQELKQNKNVVARLKKAVVDNEAQYASRLHRNIIDKSQIENLHAIHREIAAFPLSFYESELVWRLDLDYGSVSGTGDNYPVIDTSIGGIGTDPAKVLDDNAPATQVACLLDHQGNVVIVDQRGNKRVIANIPVEQATGAARIHVLTDPWTHRWLAVVPEGLPRFWYCQIPEGVFDKPQAALQEISQKELEVGESPLFATWVCLGQEPILSVITDKSRYLDLNPIKADLNIRLATVTEPGVELTNVVPRVTDNAGVVGWNSLWSDRAVAPWGWLDLDKNKTNMPPVNIAFNPEMGNWVWGRGKDVQGNLSAFLVGLERSDAGETHAVLMNAKYEPLLQQTLSVLPRQCKLLAAIETADQQFYWLATAPNFVLHLRSAGAAAPDQMSFGQRIYGATILPEGNNIRLIVVLENEVSSWRLTLRK